MNKISLLFIILLSSSFLKAQYIYEEATDIEVTHNGKTFKDPLTGGFNAVQFGEIDLNLDGINDLVVYDRFLGQVRPYINNGIADSVSYYYDPSYSSKFPLLDQFLLTADYNNDGKFDLYVGGSTLKLYENISNSSDGLKFQLVDKLMSLYNPASTNLISINPTGSNLPAIYDIDYDNDLDLWVNQGSRTIDYHRNLSIDSSSNYVPDYERRSRCWGSFFESFNKTQTRFDSIYLDSCYNFFVRGERNGIDPKIIEHQEKGLKHGGGLTITALDYDGNSSTDLLIADDGSKDLTLLLNADSVAPYVNSEMFQVFESFPGYDVPVNMLFAGTFIIDVNNDGKKDMLVASNQLNVGIPPFGVEDILYYKNVAQDGNFKFQFQTDSFLRDETLDFGRTSKPVFFDYNKDGLMDLLVGNGGYLSANNDSIYIGQMALLENTGSASKPKFEVIDYNYLNVPAIDMGIRDTLFAQLSPAVGDIDNDGDIDLLITQVNGDIFLFEDTSATGNPAAFKFHQEAFQSINDFYFRPSSSFLFDIDNNGTQELIINSVNQVKYLINLGTATNPIYNLPVDSIYWIGGDTMRYHFGKIPNYSLLNINDSLAVNNATNLNNISLTPLKITHIDSTNHFVDCINHINQGVGSDRYDEFNTNAHLSFFNNKWSFLKSGLYFSAENVFLYKDQGINQLIIGAEDGANYFLDNFIDSLQPLDTIIDLENNFMINYGRNSFVNGADINNDDIIDLVVGTNAGGLKVLYGRTSVGINDILDNSRNKENQLFQLFPNPTQSSFSVQLLDGVVPNNLSVQILDISGKLLLNQTMNKGSSTFSTNDFASGIYLIRLENESQVQVKKLVVRP